MKFLAKKILDYFGYTIEKKSELEVITPKRGENAWRELRKNDAAHIEYLLKSNFFRDLEDRMERSECLANLWGTSICEGLYIIYHLQKAVAEAPGDVCEFGVAQGCTSRLLANEIVESERHLYLFDSFEGLPAPTIEDRLIDDIFGLGSMSAYQGTMNCSEDMCKTELNRIAFPEARTHVVKGWIEETFLLAVAPKSICFAYVDLDFYKPIKAALNYVHHHSQKGARLIVDDYGFFSSGAKQATDEFVDQNPDWRLDFPLGQIMKFAVLHKV